MKLVPFVILVTLAAFAAAFSWTYIMPAESCPGQFEIPPVLQVIKATGKKEIIAQPVYGTSATYDGLCDKTKNSFQGIELVLESCPQASGEVTSVTVTIYSNKEPVKNIYPRAASTFNTGAGWTRGGVETSEEKKKERELAEKGIVREKTVEEYSETFVFGGARIVKEAGTECLAPLEPGTYDIEIVAKKTYLGGGLEKYTATERQVFSLPFYVREDGSASIGSGTYGKKLALYEYTYPDFKTRSIQFSAFLVKDQAETLITIKTPTGRSLDIFPEAGTNVILLTLTEAGKTPEQMQLTSAGPLFSTKTTFLDGATVSAKMITFLKDSVGSTIGSDLEITLSHPWRERAMARVTGFFFRTQPAQAEELNANKEKGKNDAEKPLPQVSVEEYIQGRPKAECRACLRSNCFGKRQIEIGTIQRCEALYCTVQCG